MKPTRQFSADAGEQSIGLKGPDAIEADFDKLMKMFDPEAVHSDSSPGGITGENFGPGSIGTLALEDEAVTAPKIGPGAVLDSKIGNRTINDSTTAVDTGTLLVLLSSLANRIKDIIGSGNWKDVPPETLTSMIGRLATADSNVAAAQAAAALAVAQANNAVNIANIAEGKSDVAIAIAESAVNQAGIATNIASTAEETANEAALTVADAVIDVNLAVTAAQQAVILAQSNVGNTEIKTDVFTITTADNEDGTFTYDDNGVSKTGVITVEGYQKFALNSEYYVGLNRIKAIVNDSLTRSVASGGLIEVGVESELSNEIILTAPIAAGSEISFEYYKQLSLGGVHAMNHNIGSSDPLIYMGETEPPVTYPGQIFLKVVN